jgi:23S rRNA (uracil1939-C5)-methyltransferase
MGAIAHHIIDLDVWPYTIEDGRGLLRYVVLRHSRAHDQVLVTLVSARHAGILDRLARRIMQSIAPAVGVQLHLNDRPTNAIFDHAEGDAGFRLLGGRPTVEEHLAGQRFALGPGDFFQANPAMAERIVGDVMDALEPMADRPVVDLYCGVGAFTLPLAHRHGRALGIERSPGAVDRAKDNARLNHAPAEFLAGPVGDRLSEAVRRFAGQAPVVVVDPARRGLDPDVAEQLSALRPSALAYISCNPRSLARDLSVLLQEGWVLRSLAAYDMFPQTAQVELFALLEPRSAPSIERRASRRRIVR